MMFKRISRTSGVLIALALSGGEADKATAEFVLHTKGQVYGSGSGSPSIYYDQEATGVNSVTIGPVSGSGSGNGTQTTTAFVATNPFGNSFAKLSATAESDNAGGFVPNAISTASAGWRDVISIASPGNRPDAIRLHFTVEGGMEASFNPGGSSLGSGTAGIGISFFNQESLTTRSGVFGTSVRGEQFYAQLSASKIGGETSFERMGFTSFVGDAGAFTAGLTYDALYNEDLQGYFFNIQLFASAVAGNGRAAALFGDTIKLSAVTLTDGTEIAPSDLTFDSGLQLSVVPEPASLLGVGVGLLFVGGFARASRRRADKRNLGA